MYMAPEQIQCRSIDGGADLFAAGIVLYSLLTERRPFMAETLIALMYQIVCEEPPPPSALVPELPAALDTVVMRALAKDPDRRFAGAAEFAAALRSA
jgi:serine/threonine-protein kinase